MNNLRKLTKNSVGMTSSGWLVVILIIAILIIGGLLLTHKSGGLSKNPDACVNQALSVGSSGNCVSDLQNLINWNLYGIDQPNYMKITGQYTSDLTSDISKVQSSSNLPVNGKLNLATWKVLCVGTDAPSWWTSAASNAGCKA